MNKPEAKCPELTAQTASVLDNNILQQLFVSTQQNNLELCIEYAVKRYIVPKVKKEQNIISTMKRKLSGNQWVQEDLQEAGWGILEWFPHWQDDDSHDFSEEDFISGFGWRFSEYFIGFRQNIAEIFPRLHNFIGPPPKPRQLTQLCIALVIVADHSFFIWDQMLSDNILISALNHYEESTHCKSVCETVGLVYDQNFDQNTSQVHMESSLELQLIQIVMNHRLSLNF